MTSTEHHGDDKQIIAGLAAGYLPKDADAFEKPPYFDLLKFHGALQHGGLLRPETVKMSYGFERKDRQVGMFWFRHEVAGHRAVYVGGSSPGFKAHIEVGAGAKARGAIRRGAAGCQRWIPVRAELLPTERARRAARRIPHVTLSELDFVALDNGVYFDRFYWIRRREADLSQRSRRVRRYIRSGTGIPMRSSEAIIVRRNTSAHTARRWRSAGSGSLRIGYLW